eukprot:Hpha_TRINITY_DN5144_c0_g1::TRINITY_DN5144_c0_g1_i1::g.192975::m.192975
MSDEGDREGEGEEEQEEYEFEYTPPEVIQALQNGPQTYLVGGSSPLATITAALTEISANHPKVMAWHKTLIQQITDEECTLKDKGKAWPHFATKTEIYVAPGTYDESVALTDTEAHRGVHIIGQGDPSKTVVTGGLRLGVCEAVISNMTFVAPEKQEGDRPPTAVVAECVKGRGVQVDVYNCVFKGGRNVAEFFPWTEPKFIGCKFLGAAAKTVASIYCFPQSRATVVGATAVLKETQFRPPPKAGGPPSLTDAHVGVVESHEVVLLSGFEAGGDETKWAKVQWRGQTGYVLKKDLKYESTIPTTITGNGGKGSVGVFGDDTLLEVCDANISSVETGVYLKEACREGGNKHQRWAGRAQALIKACVVEKVEGAGVYLSDGCSAAVREVRVRDCKHYALLVGGRRDPEGEVEEMLAQRETAMLRGDQLLPESTSPRARLVSYAQKITDDGIKIDEASRFYEGVRYSTATRAFAAKSGAQHSWPPPPCTPLIRDSVLNGPVKIQKGALPSFFDTLVVGSAGAVRQESEGFALTGVKYVGEEPKQKKVKRDEDEDEG